MLQQCVPKTTHKPILPHLIACVTSNNLDFTLQHTFWSECIGNKVCNLPYESTDV